MNFRNAMSVMPLLIVFSLRLLVIGVIVTDCV